MATRDPTPLGACPRCDAVIEPRNVLIEYTTGDGEAVWTECPACHAVVDPV